MPMNPMPSSPAEGQANPQALNAAPPMPRGNRSPLFTEPSDQGMGANGMGGDPLVQTMQAQQAMDKAIQTLANLYPQAIDPLAQLQQATRQLVMGLTQSAAGPQAAAGAPGMMPPLPMQGGPTSGNGMGG